MSKTKIEEILEEVEALRYSLRRQREAIVNDRPITEGIYQNQAKRSWKNIGDLAEWNE